MIQPSIEDISSISCLLFPSELLCTVSFYCCDVRIWHDSELDRLNSSQAGSTKTTSRSHAEMEGMEEMPIGKANLFALMVNPDRV
jgi:hypothetical protein